MRALLLVSPLLLTACVELDVVIALLPTGAGSVAVDLTLDASAMEMVPEEKRAAMVKGFQRQVKGKEARKLKRELAGTGATLTVVPHAAGEPIGARFNLGFDRPSSLAQADSPVEGLVLRAVGEGLWELSWGTAPESPPEELAVIEAPVEEAPPEGVQGEEVASEPLDAELAAVGEELAAVGEELADGLTELAEQLTAMMRLRVAFRVEAPGEIVSIVPASGAFDGRSAWWTFEVDAANPEGIEAPGGRMSVVFRTEPGFTFPAEALQAEASGGR